MAQIRQTSFVAMSSWLVKEAEETGKNDEILYQSVRIRQNYCDCHFQSENHVVIMSHSDTG